MSKYGVIPGPCFSRIWTEYRDLLRKSSFSIRPKITPYLDTFQAVRPGGLVINFEYLHITDISIRLKCSVKNVFLKIPLSKKDSIKDFFLQILQNF